MFGGDTKNPFLIPIMMVVMRTMNCNVKLYTIINSYLIIDDTMVLLVTMMTIMIMMMIIKMMVMILMEIRTHVVGLWWKDVNDVGPS